MYVTESRYLPDLLGGLALEGSEKGLSRVHFGAARINDRPGPLIHLAEIQFREYFAGERCIFDLPLDLAEAGN